MIVFVLAWSVSCTTPLSDTILSGDAAAGADPIMEPVPDPPWDDVPGETDADSHIDPGLVSCHSEVRITSPGDDAGVNYDTCAFTSADNEIYLGMCQRRFEAIMSGLRFPAVPVPSGAVVTRAVVRVTVDGPYDNTVVVEIAGENRGDAADFVSGVEPSLRPLTAARAAWTIPASEPWRLGNQAETPDLSPLIQEIVDRLDWEAGNALVIIFRGDTAGTDRHEHRRFIAVERGEYATALLVLDYLAPSCG